MLKFNKHFYPEQADATIEQRNPTYLPSWLFLFLNCVLSCTKTSIYEATLNWIRKLIWLKANGVSPAGLVSGAVLWVSWLSSPMNIRAAQRLGRHRGGNRQPGGRGSTVWRNSSTSSLGSCRVCCPAVLLWFAEAFTITSEFLGRCASVKRRAAPC